MTVDTGEFKALTEQVGALSRKVSALTGLVENQVGPLVRTVAALADDSPTARREPGRHAAPKPKRHLHLVAGKT